MQTRASQWTGTPRRYPPTRGAQVEGRLIYFWAKKVLIALSTLETFVRFWESINPSTT